MFETTWSNNLQRFILKLMGIVVVLPGWYRYSRGGDCHRLRYLIFPVWEKNTLSVNFVVMYRKTPKYNEFVECIERKKQIRRILLKGIHCIFVVSQSVRPQQKLVISFVAAMT